MQCDPVSPTLFAERLMRRSKSATSTQYGKSHTLAANLVAHVTKRDLATSTQYGISHTLAANLVAHVTKRDLALPTAALAAHKPAICAALRVNEMSAKIFTNLLFDAKQLTWGAYFDALAAALPRNLQSRQAWPAAVIHVFGELKNIRASQHVEKIYAEWLAQIMADPTCKMPCKVTAGEIAVLAVRNELVRLGVASAAKQSLKAIRSRVCGFSLKAALKRLAAARLANQLGDALWLPPTDLGLNSNVLGAAREHGEFANGQFIASLGYETLLREARETTLGQKLSLATFSFWGASESDFIGAYVADAQAYAGKLAETNLAKATESRINELENDELRQALLSAVKHSVSGGHTAIGGHETINAVREHLEDEDCSSETEQITDRAIAGAISRETHRQVLAIASTCIENTIRVADGAFAVQKLVAVVTQRLNEDALCALHMRDKRRRVIDPKTGLPLFPLKPEHFIARGFSSHQ